MTKSGSVKSHCTAPSEPAPLCGAGSADHVIASKSAVGVPIRIQTLAPACGCQKVINILGTSVIDIVHLLWSILFPECYLTEVRVCSAYRLAAKQLDKKVT